MCKPPVVSNRLKAINKTHTTLDMLSSATEEMIGGMGSRGLRLGLKSRERFVNLFFSMAFSAVHSCFFIILLSCPFLPILLLPTTFLFSLLCNQYQKYLMLTKPNRCTFSLPRNGHILFTTPGHRSWEHAVALQCSLMKKTSMSHHHLSTPLSMTHLLLLI